MFSKTKTWIYFPSFSIPKLLKAEIWHRKFHPKGYPPSKATVKLWYKLWTNDRSKLWNYFNNTLYAPFRPCLSENQNHVRLFSSNFFILSQGIKKCRWLSYAIQIYIHTSFSIFQVILVKLIWSMTFQKYAELHRTTDTHCHWFFCGGKYELF